MHFPEPSPCRRPGREFARFLAAVPLALTIAGTLPVSPLPAATPGSILDLGPWKIALPVTKDGLDGAGRIGQEVSQPVLDTFSRKPWFRDTVMSGKRTVLFRAHANGAKTSSNTKFARSELREMTPSPYDEAAWKFKDGKTHTLQVTQAILALPLARPQVAAAQIHDAGNDVFMLKCEGKTPGSVSAKAKLVGYVDNASKGFTVDEDYDLGTFFSLKVEVSAAGALSVYYDGKATPIAGHTDFSVVKADGDPDLTGMYFKAGCYIQSNVVDYDEKPDAYAEVAITDVKITHGQPVASSPLPRGPERESAGTGIDPLGRLLKPGRHAIRTWVPRAFLPEIR